MCVPESQRRTSPARNSKAKLTKGSRAGQAVCPDKVTGAERQSLKDEAPLAQLVLPLLNLVEPLFPRRPGTRPQGELVASPAKVDERQCEALLVLVGTRRRLIRGYCRLGAAASHERLGPDDTAACARGIVDRGDHEKLEWNGLWPKSERQRHSPVQDESSQAKRTFRYTLYCSFLLFCLTMRIA